MAAGEEAAQGGAEAEHDSAWEALERVNLVEFEIPGRAPKTGVCVSGEEAWKVLRALETRPEAPPRPAEGEPTVR